MRSNRNRKAAESRWMDFVAEQGCQFSLMNTEQIHHCAGGTARSNKVDIGEFYILPLTTHWHNWLHNEAGQARRQIEKALFFEMVYRMEGSSHLITDEVLEAIRVWR